MYAPSKWRNFLCWVVGCKKCKLNLFFYNLNSADANTIGTIAGFASIDWGAAVQVMTAVTIGTNNAIHETEGRLLYKMCFH